MKICITGAAGNLGQLTARYLLEHTTAHLNLMIHKRELPLDLANNKRVTVYKCDLRSGYNVDNCIKDTNVLIHYASVLFKANPEKFMTTTNTEYFKTVVDIAKQENVGRIILSSFPQVEGTTSRQYPSTDKINKRPLSVHAATRLKEEQYLYNTYPEAAVILRIGMVYGAGILMPDAAKWFAQRNLLGIWKEPTHIHLISKDDYLESVKNATMLNNITGTYNLGDDGNNTLQEYLDVACIQWNCKKPWRMPDSLIYSAANIFELTSKIFKIQSPLTKDFLDIGHVSYYGDTTRMRKELLPTLKYKTMYDGLETF